jgi:selenide,water dikinase
MGPEALAQVLRPLADMFDAARHPNLLRGISSPDDALVWKLDAERAIVQTADFFPPVVDDAYAFGAIAAANALSDIYAMGAEPIFAINLVGFPDDLATEYLTEILRGGADKVKEAGAVVAGGHTTTDREPKYGLAVTGIVHPDRILAKGGARPGDSLLLTKPLGTGLITTAHKKGKVEEEDLASAVLSMSRLSAGAARVFRERAASIHALTDITGFALVGHAHEMAHQSSLTLRILWERVPLLPGAERYARKGYVTGGARRNESYYGGWVTGNRKLAEWERQLLIDPQTSGGLLAAVAPEAESAVLDALRDAGEPVFRIGEAIEGEAGRILVE